MLLNGRCKDCSNRGACGASHCGGGAFQPKWARCAMCGCKINLDLGQYEEMENGEIACISCADKLNEEGRADEAIYAHG